MSGEQAAAPSIAAFTCLCRTAESPAGGTCSGSKLAPEAAPELERAWRYLEVSRAAGQVEPNSACPHSDRPVSGLCLPTCPAPTTGDPCGSDACDPRLCSFSPAVPLRFGVLIPQDGLQSSQCCLALARATTQGWVDSGFFVAAWRSTGQADLAML